MIDTNHITLTAINYHRLRSIIIISAWKLFQTDQGSNQDRNTGVGSILEQEPKSMVLCRFCNCNIICYTKVLMKILQVVLRTRTFATIKKSTCSFSLFVSQLQNPDYWKIVEGQFGEMLVGQDGDIMLEAPTWKHIQKKLNGKVTTTFWLIFSEDNSNNFKLQSS